MIKHLWQPGRYRKLNGLEPTQVPRDARPFWSGFTVWVGLATLAILCVYTPVRPDLPSQSNRAPQSGEYQMIRGVLTHVEGHYEPDPVPWRSDRLKFIPDPKPSDRSLHSTGGTQGPCEAGLTP